jgi:PIN domain nuclease of toxin-antitoxin system
MKILLDTHIILWAATDQLPRTAHAYILDESNTLYFSSASIWEVIIKNELKRSDFSFDGKSLYKGLIENGYIELPINSRHTLEVANLPMLHKDPFDRILLAQANAENLTFMTADSAIKEYSSDILFVSK